MAVKFLTRKHLSTLPNSESKYEIDGINTSNSTVGICEKKYRYRGIARVLTKTHGDIFCQYTSDIVFAEGDMVEVSISMGIPSLIKKLSFGYDNGKSMYLDIYAKKDRVGAVDEEHESPDGVEQVSMNEVSYIADVPHRVFGLGMNGIDVRYECATLFSHSATKFEASKGKAAIVARNHHYVAPGGQDLLVDNDGSPFRARTTAKKSQEGNMLPLWQELSGDVKKALENMGILSISIPSKSFKLDELVKLDILFGDEEDLEKYALKIETVSHTYINRKLSISDEFSGDEIVVNKALLPSLGFPIESLKYSCGIANGADGKQTPILYIKAIMATGDIVEYSAGVKEEVTMSSLKIDLLERKVVSLGKNIEVFQSGKTILEYPISTSSRLFTDRYSPSIELNRGDKTIVNYRPIKERKIQHETEYEVDLKSGISTHLYVNVPVRVTTVVNDMLLLQKHKDLENQTVNYAISGKDGGDSLYFNMDLKKSIFLYQGNSRAGKSRLFLSPSYGAIETSDALQFKTKSLVLDTEITINKGVAVFEKGLQSSGKFIVQSDDIFLIAANTLQFGGRNIYAMSENNMFILYKQTFSVGCSEKIIREDKTTSLAPAIILGAVEARIQAEKALVYGASSVVAVAKDNATFGAEKTVLYGIEND